MFLKGVTALLVQGPGEGRPLCLAQPHHLRASVPTAATALERSRPGNQLSVTTDGFPELELPLLATRALRNPAGDDFLPARAREALSD